MNNDNLKRFIKTLITLAFVSLISACSVTPSDYQDSTPEFDMAVFFNGKLKAYGMVQDRSGKVIRRFEADLIGTWKGNEGLLEEDFYYDDGETQRRVWTLKKIGNNQYIGTAGDVIGIASGESQGFAFNWHYTLAIDIDGETWNIKLDDWLYQLNDTRLINRTEMTKWGFKVGDITLVIEKL